MVLLSAAVNVVQIWFKYCIHGPRLALARLLTDLRCNPGQFACRSGKMQCIPLSWQCDGWTACDDKSDEIDCPTIKEERYRYSNGFEPVEDVMGVAQPVRFNRSMQVFLPPEGLANLGEGNPTQDNVFCAQLQRFQIKNMNERGLHSWHAENCYKKFPFLCKRRQTCVDIRDNVVNEGYYFTPKGDDPCLSCTCHDGEPEMCVAALCERPQGCQHFRKDPKECCKFTCLDPDGSSLFDSMASGMRLIVSCISSFLILSLLLFMVHRLRQRRRERIETLIGGNLHHFNLGRRVPGFDYGPDAFGTGLTPLHLSDDGEGGAFHFQEPPPPYAAYKYPDIHHPDDPPPSYEASINPDSILYMDLRRTGVPLATGHMSGAADSLQRDFPEPVLPAPPPPPLEEREDSIDSSTLLVSPDTPSESESSITQSSTAGCSGPSLSTVV
ncbi:hypothetical protein cypCar_00018609 [Cyprinus carpio]|nr:hypothetical protein cypCar_00018609 [Cyprinus carpio]